MIKIMIALAVALLAGCEGCPPSFREGDIVKHKLFGWTGIVLRDAASTTNFEGYCLVSVRDDERGMAGSYAAAELERVR